jgi:hypothetical protein
MPYANISSRQLHQLAPTTRRLRHGHVHGTSCRPGRLRSAWISRRAASPGEEADHRIRMLAAGYASGSDSVPSTTLNRPGATSRGWITMVPQRDLFTRQNVSGVGTATGPLTGRRADAHLNPRRLVTCIGGVIDGLVSCLREERAVSADAFALWRRLRHASRRCAQTRRSRGLR